MHYRSLWTLKSILLVFYAKVVEALWYGCMMIRIIIVLLVITFCVSLITAFVECQPTSLYWTVVADPGSSFPHPLLVSLFFKADLDRDGEDRSVCPRAQTHLHLW
jgi:hypothetical protein